MTTYVRRDSVGRVIALSTEPLPDFVEADPSSREIEDFLRGADAVRTKLDESDLEVIRVLDDLVNLMVQKNLIRYTDLPAPAQRKLNQRRGLRSDSAHLQTLVNPTTAP